LGDLLAFAAAMQGAVFFGLLCGLRFAAAGAFFGTDDESEAGWLLFVAGGAWA
jgi:hypothetical protein